MSQVGRPTRPELVQLATLAGVSRAHARSFWSRAASVSVATQHKLAVAAVQVGYRPTLMATKRRPLPLGGLRFGYEIPRSWDERPSNPVYSATLGELALQLERQGATLLPFVIDPEIPGYRHRVNEREDPPELAWPAVADNPDLQHQAWLRAYAQAIAPARYRQIWRSRQVNGFFLNDPRAEDGRLDTLTAERAPTVLIGRVNTPAYQLPFADMDDEAGFSEICRRVLAVGASRVMHLGFTADGSGPPLRRHRAVRRTLGSALVASVERDYNDRSGPERIIEAIRLHEPDAIVCDSDDFAALATAAVRMLVREGVLNEPRRPRLPLRYPLITGCDDAPVRASSADPWMTLRPDYSAWISAAVELMIDTIKGTPPTDTARLIRHYVIPAGQHQPTGR